MAALACFAGFLYWIHAEDVEGRTEASEALSGHVVEYHVRIDTALLHRLDRLEVKVDSNYVKTARQGVLLRALDTRTQLILEAVLD